MVFIALPPLSLSSVSLGYAAFVISLSATFRCEFFGLSLLPGFSFLYAEFGCVLQLFNPRVL